MEDNKLIKYESGQLAKVSNAIAVTNKIMGLAKTEPLLIPYRKGNKWGFCREDKTIVIDCVYQEAHLFCEDLAIVKFNHKWGYINKEGNEIIPLKYDRVNPFNVGTFSEGMAKVKLNGKCGFINKVGINIIPFKYDYVESFSEGFAVVRLDGKYGFVNKDGIEIISLKYDNAKPFSEGLTSVMFNGKYGFINKEGIEIIEFKYGIPKFSVRNIHL